MSTMPFDMTVLNAIDRFQSVKDIIDRVSSLGPRKGASRK
jgi:phosphoketolase